MSKNSEKVYTEGRITYVEPNDFLADKEYSASRYDSFNITHPYEDYAISVDLIVTIPDRFTGKSNDFIIELNNDKDGKTTSFFNGEGGYLNCTPGSSTFLDIMNGDTAGHQENLGITNINITYNSYFYPEVTMNLVDVRGLSLMAPNEENYRRAEVNRYARELAKKQGDKYQPVYDEKIENFFSALFTFPYPEFKLRVKGFYGKKVEYSLLVNDFKSSFNSQSGNFEATVKFIGKMYGLYTDIPMSYLMIAPYCRYGNENNETIWEKSHLEIEDGIPMPTFLDLRDKLLTLKKELPINMDFETVNKYKDYKSRLDLLQEIKNTYLAIIGRISGSSTLNKFAVTGENNIFFIISSTEEENAFTYDAQLSEYFKILYKKITEYTHKTGEYLPYFNSNNQFDNQNGIIHKKKENSHIYKLVDNNKYKIQIDSSTLIDDIYSQDDSIYYDKEVDLSILKDRQFENNIIKLFNSSNNKTYTRYEGDKKRQVYHGLLLSGTNLNYILTNKIEILKEDIDKIIDETKEEYIKVTDNLLGFRLTLKNIVKITMAHLQCFMQLYSLLITNVKDRNISDMNGVAIEMLDIPNNYKNTTVPLFPGIKNNKTNEFCYPTDVIKTYDMEEVHFIDSLFDCMSDFNNKIPDSNISENKDDIEIIPTLSTDLIDFQNPYKNILSENTISDIDIDKIMTYFGIRCMSYCFEKYCNNERSLYISAQDFGSLEAYNFWKANPNLSDIQLNKLKSDDFNTTNFKKFLLGESCVYIPKGKKPYYSNNNTDKLLSETDNNVRPNGNFNIPSVIKNINIFWEHSENRDNKGRYGWVYTDNKFNNLYSPYEYIQILDYDTIKNYNEKINTINLSDYISDDNKPTIIKHKIRTIDFFSNVYYGKDYPKDFISGFQQDNVKSGFDYSKLEDKSNYKLCSIVSATSYEVLDRTWKGYAITRYTSLFFDENLTSRKFLSSFPHKLRELFLSISNIITSSYITETSVYGQGQLIEFPYITQLYLGMILNIINTKLSDIDINMNMDDKIKYLRKELNLTDKSIVLVSGILFELLRLNNGEHLSERILIRDFSENEANNCLIKFIKNFGNIKDFLKLEEEYINWSTSEEVGKFQYLLNAYCLKEKDSAEIKKIEGDTKYKRLIKLISDNSSYSEYPYLKEILNENYYNDNIEATYYPFTDRYCNIYYKDLNDKYKQYYLIFNQDFYAYKYLEQLLNKKGFLLKPYYTNNTNLNYKWDGVFSTHFTYFNKTLRNLYNLNNKANIDIDNDVEKYNASKDAKLSMYMTLKNLYDKHLVTLNNEKDKYIITNENSEFKRFHFIDTFYNDLSNDMYVNIEQLLSIINDIINPYKESQGLFFSNLSVYSFLSLLAERNNMMLLAMPVFNGLFTKSDNPNSSSIEDMFTPFTYLDTVSSNTLNGPSYVYFYPHQPSKHLDIPESQYKGDGFNIIPDINNTYNFNGEKQISELYKDVEIGGYIIPSFGVEYGTQKQSIFKNINVNMDNPQTTEVAVANQFAIAQGRNVDVKQPGFEGQDLYQIYCNYSYTCQVEMMGCAQIMPLMYFQLNNIPMFRGAYQIINVNHNITPGNMSTTFKGVRIANRKIPMVKNLITISSIIDLINNLQGGTQIQKYTPYDGVLLSDWAQDHSNTLIQLKDNDVMFDTINNTIQDKRIIFAESYSSYQGYSKIDKQGNIIQLYQNNNVDAFNNVNPDLRKLLCCIGKRVKELNLEYKMSIMSCTRTINSNSNSDHFIPSKNKEREKKTYTKNGDNITYGDMGCAVDIVGCRNNGSVDNVYASLPLFDLIAVEFTDNIKQLIWEHKTGVSTQQDSVSNCIHIASYGKHEKHDIFVAEGPNFNSVKANNSKDMTKAPTNLPPTFIRILQRLSCDPAKYDTVNLNNFTKKPTHKDLTRWCRELNVPVDTEYSE